MLRDAAVSTGVITGLDPAIHRGRGLASSMDPRVKPEGDVEGPEGDVVGPEGDVVGPEGDVVGPEGDVEGVEEMRVDSDKLLKLNHQFPARFRGAFEERGSKDRP